jgi:mRNA-degrading endonuclease toxin of MazEF toxin-antitoxin module
MKVSRGDVVLVPFPQSPGLSPKRRPALVVQSDHNNARLANSIFTTITSNTRLAQVEPTQVIVEIDTLKGRGSGLAQTSAVKCENVHMLPQSAVARGSSGNSMAAVWFDGVCGRGQGAAFRSPRYRTPSKRIAPRCSA